MSVKEAEISERFNLLVENLKKNYSLSYDEILILTSKVLDEKKILIPIEALDNRELGMLESVTIYLKDKKDMKFSEIAKALQRDQRTIWATYHNAKEKLRKDGKKK